MKNILRMGLFCCLLAIGAPASAAEFFVAPNGSDTALGTIGQPFATLARAQQAVTAGDTVFLRGGTYQIQEPQIAQRQGIFAYVIQLNKSGTSGKPILYRAYQDEKPVFDFSLVKPAGLRVYAFSISGSWLHLQGIEVTGVQVTITEHTQSICFESNGSHNIFERLTMHDGQAIGIYHIRGSDNLFLNCDAWNNYDYTSEGGKGGNVDGFGCHPTKGSTGNVFRGCRAWFNSDDGFDLINSQESVTFEHCWAFYNGYSPGFVSRADGNGFKAGGYGLTPDPAKLPNPIPRHTIRFCVAVGNKASGFYANHHLGGSDWVNNTAYRNGTNFNMLNRVLDPLGDVDGYDHKLRNNLGYKARSKELDNLDRTKSDAANNSFDLNLPLSSADFASLDESELTRPRQANGDLPVIGLLHPSPQSAFVNKGVDIGFPFQGAAPDLGAFELGIVDAPTNLTATAGNAQVVLNWTASAGATSYNVKRATVSGGPYTTIPQNVSGTTYTDTGLINGVPYYYVVSAQNIAGESGNSNEASATPAFPNTAPVAKNDVYSLNANNTLVSNAPAGVLANDTDAQGDPLSVVDVAPSTPGVQPVSGPTHGTLNLSADGSFSYTPAVSYNGSDSFSYRAADGTLTSNTATVTLTINAPVNIAPSTVSLSPAVITSAAAETRLLRANYSDPNGAGDIRYAFMQLGETGRFGLRAAYDQPNNKLYLLDDNGTRYIGGFAPGSNNVISNTQARLNCTNTVVSPPGNLLTIDWSLTPLSPLAHSPKLSGSSGLPLSLFVQDKAGLKDGYDKLGTWTISGNQPPQNASLSPSGAVTNVVGAARTFRATYSDPNGFSNIRFVYLQVKSGTSGVLRVGYNLHTNKLYLLKPDGSGYDGGIAPGTRRTLSNSFGALSCEATRVSTLNATTLQVDWVIVAGSSLTGTTSSVLLYVQDQGNLSDGFDQGAMWTINNKTS